MCPVKKAEAKKRSNEKRRWNIGNCAGFRKEEFAKRGVTSDVKT
jgi:hypothetical protein